MLETVIFKLALAVALGGVIGFERQLKHKAAGLKTNVLITVGSALFTIISEEFGRKNNLDGARVAAQIVSGIGFLGAGVIIQSRGSVIGLTTAATIFVVAAIGMAIGWGFYLTAGAATLLIFGTLYGLGFIEHRFFLHYQSYLYSVAGRDPVRLFARITQILKEHKLQAEDVGFQKQGDRTMVSFRVDTTAEVQAELMHYFLQTGRHSIWEEN